MKLSQTVFLTTIYPDSQKYLDDFFLSLKSQSTNDFDVLVVNDGVKDFKYIKEEYSTLNIKEEKCSSSPSKNREFGIKKAIELGYSHIVFGDSDDYFSENRIEESIKALKQYDIVINELTVVSDNNNIEYFLSNNLKSTKAIHKNILNSNVFGFSNIAINSSIIPNQFVFENNLIAVDWFFVSLLFFQKEQRITFLAEAFTFYRQHSTNTVGISMTVNEKKLELGLNVKRIHYTTLYNHCVQNKIYTHSSILKNKLQELHHLNEKLLIPLFKTKYLKIVNANMATIFSGWWSEVISLEKFHYYENKN